MTRSPATPTLRPEGPRSLPPLPVPPWIVDLAPDVTAADLPLDDAGTRAPAELAQTPLATGVDVSATEAALLRAELWRELRDVQRGLNA